jgi:hypothetical protein
MAALDLDPGRRPTLLRALESLVKSDVIRPRPGASAVAAGAVHDS